VMTAEAGLYPLVRGREERTKTKTTKTTTFWFFHSLQTVGYVLHYFFLGNWLLNFNLLSTVIHWALGVSYMFSFATVIGWLHAILRKGTNKENRGSVQKGEMVLFLHCSSLFFRCVVVLSQSYRSFVRCHQRDCQHWRSALHSTCDDVVDPLCGHYRHCHPSAADDCQGGTWWWLFRALYLSFYHLWFTNSLIVLHRWFHLWHSTTHPVK
jgi:hypothetical protein